jgi:hypothetical protein
MLTQPGGETVTVTAVEHVHRPVVDPPGRRRVGAARPDRRGRDAREAVRLANESGQRLVRARALTALADLYEATGEPAGLVRAQALALYDDMAIRPAVANIPAR